MRPIALIAMTCWLPLAACSTVHESEGQPSPHAGEAVRQNIAVQLVNPEAPAKAGPQTMDGRRAALAQDRYVKGKTIVPADMEQQTNSTSNGNSGGSNGGSSSSP